MMIISLKENIRVFEGNAKETIDLLPTQVNVAVSTSLAMLGHENMQVTIDSIADLKDDEFNIYVTAEDAKVKISIVSAPHLSSRMGISSQTAESSLSNCFLTYIAEHFHR